MINLKYFVLVFSISLAWPISAQSLSGKKKIIKPADLKYYEIDTIAIGDIDHNKIFDTVFIKGTPFSPESNYWDDCSKTDCAVTLSFSNGFPDITFDNAVACSVENIGDIDNDGFDEIVIAPSWIIGCWGKLHFFSFKNKQWKYVGFVEQNICDDTPFLSLIKKKGKNKIAVEEQIWKDDDRVTKIKIIKIK